MNYQFPIIKTIDDVLPHIAGRNEFVVANRDFGTVINYAVAMADTFDMTGPDDLSGSVRRECRGLIFDRDGNLISRPFHKFFNIGEREETQPHRIDLSQPHTIMEKMDGSMIRPLVIDGHLRLATKMGVTEVAMDAEAWLAAQSSSHRVWLVKQMMFGETPIFEWVSPFNQIVLAYEEADLVYLGNRNNTTGEYSFLEDHPFTKVPRYGSVEGNLNDYLAGAREQQGREGDIIAFADGHRVKVKNDWYVRIHKVLDRVRFDRNIVKLILKEEIDDAAPLLPPHSAERIRNFETDFWRAFKQKENRLYGLRIAAQQSYDDDRKRIALEFVPTLENPADAQFIFRMLDGHSIRDLLLAHIEKNISTNVKWDACALWLGM